MAQEAVAIPRISQPGISLIRALETLWRFARRKPLGAFSAGVILLLLLTATLADVLAPYRYDEFNIPERLQGPSVNHLFGTDDQGRDVLSRVIYGTRASVFTGFGALGVTILVATTIGIISAHYGGLVDLLFQRLVDIWQAFPGLILIIFLVIILGPGITTLIITIGLLFAARTSRVIRGAALAVKAHPYIEAAKVTGALDTRIIAFHVLPNVFPIVLILASIEVGSVILIESSLSFLGYGIPPPFPSWGRMLSDAQLDTVNHPYLAIFPGAAIALVVYSFNMFGDALRDVLDPRMRGTS